MNWITEEIAIGNNTDAKNKERLREYQIRSVLGLIDTLKDEDPEEWGLEEIEILLLEDNEKNRPEKLIRAIEILNDLVQYSSPVMVHCHAGRSRSVIVVAGYLMKYRGMTRHQAIAYVAERRDIAITPGIEKLLDHI